MAIQERANPGTAGADLVPLGGDVKNPLWGLVVSIYRALETIITLLEGRLSLGDGTHSSWTGHLDGQYHVIDLPAASPVPFAVPHGLGRTPVGYLIVRRSAAGVEVRDAPLTSSDDQQLWLEASAAGRITLLIW